MNYGSGLEIEWSEWELLKIQEIKDRRKFTPSRRGFVRCSWEGCRRAKTHDSSLCAKHRKLIRLLGSDWQQDY